MHALSIRTLAITTILALGMPLLGGCTMSRSSSRMFASMASIWSLSASFQSSFGAQHIGLNEDYAFDIATVGATNANADSRDVLLFDDVNRVAESHGVTDWEVLDETWIGLGIGLRHAGLSEDEARGLVTRVFGDDMAQRTLAAAYVD